jgi:hypothetical protein
LGDGAWFNLDTSRLGITAADLNGDGRDDVVYHGRCERSVTCWRVHLSEGTLLSTPQDWGDGARLAPSARAVVAGDWNGDGFDDLVYEGICGSEPAPCWRAHLSSNGSLVAADWGAFPDGARESEVSSADLNGDGKEDLLYPAGCQAGTCWYGQISTGTSFGAPVNLGMTRPEELASSELFDWDGDGDDDLLTGREAEGGAHDLDVRRMGPEGLGDVTTLNQFGTPLTGVTLRRLGPGRPVEALVSRACEQAPCVDHLLSLSGRMMPVDEYARAVELPPRRSVGFYPG